MHVAGAPSHIGLTPSQEGLARQVMRRGYHIWQQPWMECSHPGLQSPYQFLKYFDIIVSLIVGLLLMDSRCIAVRPTEFNINWNSRTRVRASQLPYPKSLEPHSASLCYRVHPERRRQLPGRLKMWWRGLRCSASLQSAAFPFDCFGNLPQVPASPLLIPYSNCS